MKLYKLTDEDGQSYNDTQWGKNVTHTTDGRGELCGPGWLHAYTHPLLAVLLNPVHADFSNPILWETEGEVEKTDKGLKIGTTKLTTITQIPLPKITLIQKVTFAILCVKKVYKEEAWNMWADNWLSNKDRSTNAAKAAANAAYDAAAYAANAANDAANAYATNAAAYSDPSYAAANASYAAANAAANASYAAKAALTTNASYAAAAYDVANAANDAAYAAAYSDDAINLEELAEKAMEAI